MRVKIRLKTGLFCCVYGNWWSRDRTASLNWANVGSKTTLEGVEWVFIKNYQGMNLAQCEGVTVTCHSCRLLEYGGNERATRPCIILYSIQSSASALLWSKDLQPSLNCICDTLSYGEKLFRVQRMTLLWTISTLYILFCVYGPHTGEGYSNWDRTMVL